MREIALHVLDLIQNSIEAGASFIQVEICEKPAQDRLSVRVADNGAGMDEQMLTTVTDPFTTSRKTRKIGLGLPLLEMTAQRADGKLTIHSQPGVGTEVMAVYRYSHWDRPPLGNMAVTLKVVIAGNPLINLSYRHCVEAAEFAFDTREIRKLLEDVPLNTPEVLVWIEQYLSENIDNLYGGAEHEDR